MNERSEKAEEILIAAERRARSGGYNSFSFRDIANDVGVKSASVHYHFATKEALGAAIAHRYTENFLAGLGDPQTMKTPQGALKKYIGAYRVALINDGLMCLCGVLGAEFDALPKEVADEAKRFFERNIEWLSAALVKAETLKTPARRRAAALRIIATLEGAMILARTLSSHDIFEESVRGLESLAA